HLSRHVGPRGKWRDTKLSCPARRSFGREPCTTCGKRGDQRTERAHRHHQKRAPWHRPVDDLSGAPVTEEQHVEDDREADRDDEELPASKQPSDFEATVCSQRAHDRVPTTALRGGDVSATKASSRSAPTPSKS